jgi:hypothetical protein
MKHLLTFILILFLSLPAFSQKQDEVKRWNVTLSYDLNHLNYSFKTFHFGVDQHWRVLSFNAVDLAVSYNVFRSINIGAGININLHSIHYDKMFINLYFRNYEKFRWLNIYPEFRFGLIRARTEQPGTLQPTLFGNVNLMIEFPIEKDFMIAFGPGFTYFTDAFTYGYWEVRYAPILGKTIYVRDPVSAKNFLVNLKVGVKYNF